MFALFRSQCEDQTFGEILSETILMEYFVLLHSCSVFDSEYYLPAVIEPERFSQYYFPLDLIQLFSVPNIDFKMLFLSVLLLFVLGKFNITLFTFTLSL